MSIASEITRLQSAKNTLKTKLNAKNDNEHQISNETIDEYGDFVDSIPVGKLTNAEYTEADNDVDDILENTVVPSGTISITTNGTHDVTNYISANVNVVGENNAKIDTSFTGNDCTIKRTLLSLPEIDVSNANDLNNAFEELKKIETISLINMNSNLTMSSSFSGCSSLVSVSITGSGKPSGMALTFNGCSSLVDIPSFDGSMISNMNNCFIACPSLSNESLNKILLLCATTTSRYGYDKTLKKIGLSSTQATTCTTLSNWATAQAAGWTTGY